MVRTVCGMQLRAKFLMQMLGLTEAVNQMAMANRVHWYVMC